MIRAILRFIAREAVIILLLLASLAPAFFLGIIADVVSTRLYLLSVEVDGYDGQLPILSEIVVDTVAGYHGFPVGMAVMSWLLTVLWFLISAFTTSESPRFRIRFLPGFFLIWSGFVTFVSAILSAWALVLATGYTRIGIDDPWYVTAMPYAVLGELALIVAIPLWFFFWRVRPNPLVPRDPNPRERGFGPVNSDR